MQYIGPTRVAIVEDHPVLRDGLALLLTQSGYTVVGAASTAAEGFDLVAAERPSVAVVGVLLADEPGTLLARRILTAAPETRVLIYTGVRDPAELEPVFACGAHGVLSKSAQPAELREAMRTVAGGGTYLDEGLRALLRPAGGEQPCTLSRREREVVALLASGLTLEQMGSMLGLSAETVRTHVRNAGRRLGGRTRAHTVALALRRGEIEG